ncbi:hypothetical protein EAS64_33625 [Trebonia kvetii]|uniref:Uncharacterized protein n=1 Tax=Trebonia kvetii TaxID=2480626 RepID=A0A6P2BS13_9ACTN|nr:hypothetical protein [Trebonia kvetii]TVZ01221.1 hypothetical protein EAS64_33625 [Trebonia kvetii]
MTSRTPLAIPVTAMAHVCARVDALLGLGARVDNEWAWYIWPTAEAAWDREGKLLLIAADEECLPEDFKSVCDLLRDAGWMRGHPEYDDIGEPTHDQPNHVWTWVLRCP